MKKNMGLIDRVLRAVLAVVIGLLYLGGQITGMAALILGIFAAIFLVTSSIGYCPVYTLLGVSTLKGGEHHDEGHHGAAKGAH